MTAQRCVCSIESVPCEVVTFFGLPDREENPFMAKYSKEQRDRAVDLYIRYERCAADVIHELGYPSKGIGLATMYWTGSCGT